jgi:tRNA threonylcarbamoyladenosine biosynthesis protein TsaE
MDVASGFSRTTMTQITTTHSETETSELGRDLASGLGAGSVVLLYGDLGAGKTAFVRGLAEGVGVTPDDVSSPTFTIMQEYRGGRVTLFHVDLYRLENPREIEDLGLSEVAGDGILVIEWADRLPQPPADAIHVRLEHEGEQGRKVTIYD